MKKVNPFLYLVLISLIVTGCKTPQQTTYFEENPPFSINNATYQKWVAGTQEGGKGTNVTLEFEYIDSGVMLKDVFFDSQVTALSPLPNQQNTYMGYFTQNSNRNFVMDGDVVKEVVNTLPKKNNFDLEKNQAVISYLKEGKLHYVKLDELIELPLLAYPSTNGKEN